ncbi:hypothetical protein HK102_006399 [Quaeritorhiza haematococci]|nr:hypothetical protein HK102_006399 [Quaeritorhiza haematococci]
MISPPPIPPPFKRHLYRREKLNTVMSGVIEKMWPNEYKAMALLKGAEEKLWDAAGFWLWEKHVLLTRKDADSMLDEEDEEILGEGAVSSSQKEALAHALNDFLTPAVAQAPNLLQTHLARMRGLAILGEYEEALHEFSAAWFLASSNIHVQEARKFIDPIISLNPSILPPPPLPQPLPSEDPAQIPNLSDLECHLCLNLLFDPVTTPCGHTWCRACLLQAIEHNGKKCPLCRTQLPSHSYFVKRSSNKVVEALARKLFDGVWKGREQATMEKMVGSWGAGALGADVVLRGLSPSGTAGRTIMKIPIFVCSLVFPGMTYGFHMFEPRYRVMLKRASETNRRFGICMPRVRPLPPSPTSGSPNPNDEFYDELVRSYEDYGTLVDIRMCEPLPRSDLVPTTEGPLPRYVVETYGMYRFRVLRRELDESGYHVAYVERVDDLEVDDVLAEEIERRATASVSSGQEQQPQQQQQHSNGHAHQNGNMPGYSTASSTLLTPNPTSSSSSSSAPTSSSDPHYDPIHLHRLVRRARLFIRNTYTALVPAARLQLERAFGPPPDDPADLSFWLANLLPVGMDVKYELLAVTSVEERLERVCAWIDGGTGGAGAAW